MKAISIRNPFAHMILCGEKEFEFRTWQTDYRGDLLICSSSNPKIKNTICGHALIVVQLQDIFEVTAKNYKDFGLDKKPDQKMYAWQLTDGMVIKPFPVKGKLHLFDVDDSLIDYLDEEGVERSEEEVDELVHKYIVPLLYKGRN